MKRLIILSLASLFVLALSGSASAVHFENFNASADCEGWMASGEVIYAGIGFYAGYHVELYEGSALVVEFVDSFWVGPGALTFDFDVPWGVELCGEYTATGVFAVPERKGGDTEEFTVSFICDCEEPPCTFTPGYWKNHPDAWPVSELTLGGITYDMPMLMEILDTPTRGRMPVKLAHHLIAAKLNVLSSGYGGEINDAIADADDFLAMHAIFSRPWGEEKDTAEAIKNILCAFNELPCPDELGLDVLESRTPLGAGAEEETTWGGIKSRLE